MIGYPPRVQRRQTRRGTTPGDTAHFGRNELKEKDCGRTTAPVTGTSSAGPFRRGKKPVQCYRCNGWGHYKLQCPNEEPIEGSREWENLHGEETKEGGPLPQEQEANPQQ